MISMHLGGCVVVYNPGVSVLDNIKSYLPVLEKLVVVDNSTSDNEFVESLKSFSDVEIINMGGNKGIAAALNAGCQRLTEVGCDVALTMDQDSVFPAKHADSILRAVEKLLETHAIVGLDYEVRDNLENNLGTSDEPVFIDVDYWITSGNFISLEIFQEIDGFNEELFIDYVDTEFCQRVRRVGKAICYLPGYALDHEIGSPIEFSLFGRTYRAMNHSPVRYYYRYRNSLYLFRKDKVFYREKFFKEFAVNIPKMLLFEPHKREKLKMIVLGIKDGSKGILGPYERSA